MVTRHFAAPPSRVFDAWVHCEALEKWMFGPAVRDEEIVHLAVDPRVGGSFSYLIERHGEAIDHVGKFLELVRPARLAFTWMVAGERMGSRVLVDIAPRDDGSELTLVHELHPTMSGFAPRVQAAWSDRFDALARALAAA